MEPCSWSRPYAGPRRIMLLGPYARHRYIWMVISVHLACPPAQHYLVPKNSSVTHRRRCSLFTSRKVKGMVGGGIASRSLVWGGKIMHAPYLAMMAIMMMLHSIARSFLDI